ncbi:MULTISPECIES: tetratricopeptide repeat protein [Lysobacteraceae]|nr:MULTISPECIES: tetratricopeptide repeat protein [Lysobacter]
MKQGMPWVLGAMLCACSAQATTEPQSLERITARLDESGGMGGSIQDVPAALDAWLAAHPDSSDAWIQYARYYLKAGYISGDTFAHGTFERAADALDRAGKLAPQDPNVDVLRGHLLTNMGRLDDADAALARAQARGGDANPWLRINRGNLRLEQDRWQDAMQECDIAATRKDLSAGQRLAADQCRIQAYRWKGDADTAERIYRDAMAYAGDNAWHHGNFAQFLLCSRDNPKAAVEEARRARALMDYGIAQATEGAALTRLWSMQVSADEPDAEATYEAAAKTVRDPVDAYIDMCGPFPYGQGVAREAFLTGRMAARSVPDAIQRAAEAGERGDRDGLFGVYRMQVKSQGRSAGIQYLSSELDYRDPRNLSLSISPEVQEDWRINFGPGPEQILLGKEIYVIGEPRRVRIDFMADGKPTGKYYYQTQLAVESSFSIMSPEIPPARPQHFAHPEK